MFISNVNFSKFFRYFIFNYIMLLDTKTGLRDRINDGYLPMVVNLLQNDH